MNSITRLCLRAARELCWPVQRMLWRVRQRRRGSRISGPPRFVGVRPPFHLMTVGENIWIEPEVTLMFFDSPHHQPHLTLGSRCYVGRRTIIDVFEPIRIGRSAMIAADCHLISGNHRFERRDVPIWDQGHVGAPVVIGDDVWLGAKVVVLPGVTIGRGAVVAAGSVVSKSIPAYEVWGGVPARFIKTRPD